MIYPFRAKATDELIMLSQHARPLLGMLAKANGKSGDGLAYQRKLAPAASPRPDAKPSCRRT